VENLKPYIRSHTRFHRHTYRNERWYVLQDISSGRNHRFNSASYHIIGLMNGDRTVQEIWDAASTTLGDNAPSQDEMIQLLGQLHSSDVLQCNVSPDILELFQRQEKHAGNKLKQRTSNPFAIRFPLLDPDSFLEKWKHVVKPLFSWVGVILWILVVGTGIILAASNWPDLSENVTDRLFAPKNLFLIWLAYPLVKAVHELSHAFATKIWGGEVHEMGIMLLALTPIPYVDATASTAFSEKRMRITVAAAGISMEIFVASLALFLWLNMEPGLAKAFAYNVMLIGGVSTIFFNANPLLRFDGYYILADAIEIPNLGGRSTKYLGYLLQRYLFGVDECRSPVTAKGEKPWFVVYGIAAFIYRMFILTVLTLFIGGKFFFIGVLIAGWALVSQIVLPVIRNCEGFYNSPAGRRNRTRFLAASFSVAMFIAVCIFIVPAPLSTRVEGVVLPPEQCQVRAGTDCFIISVDVSSHTDVKQGDALLRCEDPFLEAHTRVLEARLNELEATYNAEPLENRVQREIIKDEITTVNADLSHSRDRMRELIIRSPKEGLFVLPEAQNLLGRYLKNGALIGYVIDDTDSTVRVVVSQAEIAMVREQTESVGVRLASNLKDTLVTSLGRQFPAAGYQLPSPVLSTNGGGTIPVDPTDLEGLRTLKKIFQFDLVLPKVDKVFNMGSRVYVRFDHGSEPLAFQWYCSFRQLFLRRFNV